MYFWLWCFSGHSLYHRLVTVRDYKYINVKFLTHSLVTVYITFYKDYEVIHL